jgi:hypothetical protein
MMLDSPTRQTELTSKRRLIVPLMNRIRIHHEAGQTVALLQRATKGKPSAEAGESNKASAVSFCRCPAQRS